MNAARLTRAPGGRILLSMRAVSPPFRVLIALFAALAVVVAGPLHATHNHGGDLGQLDGTCAVCKSHTTACGPDVLECAGPLLQPLGALASESRPAAVSAPRTISVPRAPPVSIA